MTDDDYAEIATAVGNSQGAALKATAGLFTALLATLIDKTVISAECVEKDILGHLADFYKSHPVSDDEDGLSDADEARIALQLIEKVRIRLGFD